MNAVIVDIRKKQAAALDENGRIVRIHNADYEIGQQIELHEIKPVRTPTMLKRFSSGVAAAVLVAMIGTGTAYAVPYGTVTLDGDSSVEYTINCFDYVIDVKATNEEGEALLSEMDTRQLRHHRIDAAVATTVEHIAQHAPTEPPEEELRIRAETRGERHSDRLREELEPLLEREPPAPQEGDRGPETPPAEGDMPPADPGQFPGRVESPEQDGIQQDAPAVAHEPAPDGTGPNDPPTAGMGFSLEESLPNPEEMLENGVGNEGRFFMPNAPEAALEVKQEMPPEMEQVPNMERGGN